MSPMACTGICATPEGLPKLKVQTQYPAFLSSGAPAWWLSACVVNVPLTRITGRGLCGVGGQSQSFAPGGGSCGEDEADRREKGICCRGQSRWCPRFAVDSSLAGDASGRDHGESPSLRRSRNRRCATAADHSSMRPDVCDGSQTALTNRLFIFGTGVRGATAEIGVSRTDAPINTGLPSTLVSGLAVRRQRLVTKDIDAPRSPLTSSPHEIRGLVSAAASGPIPLPGTDQGDEVSEVMASTAHSRVALGRQAATVAAVV